MNNKYVKMSGGLTQLDVGLINAYLQNALNEVGAIGVETMRSYTEKDDATGSLTKSIMWRTKLAAGGNEGGSKEITVPDESNAVHMGSASDHAYWREMGTGAHRSSEGTELFIENMIEWCRIKLGFDPQIEDNQARFWNIVNAIRKRGTAEAPFALPSVDIIRMKGSNIIKGNTVRMWKERRVK